MLEIPCPKCKSKHVEGIDAVYYESKQKNCDRFLKRLAPPIRPKIDENFGDRYMVKLKQSFFSKIIFVLVLGISMLFFSFLSVVISGVISIVIAFIVTMKFEDYLGDPLQNYLKECQQELESWQTDIDSRANTFICMSCESLIEIIGEE